MKHRILSLVLAIALLLTLAPSALAVTLDPSVPPPQDPFGKYDPAIDVTTVHTANDGAFWFPAGDDINNNVYTRKWADTLGINYKFLWTVPGSQGSERMNVMIASGDLPDFFAVNQKQFVMLQKAGQLEDLTQSIEDYASQYTKKYLSGQYQGLLDVATVDGKVYGLTNGFTYHDTCQMIWIRADWLKKLNLELPKTLADLENIMEAFKTKDPDGNGVDDTYPISMTGELNPSLWGMRPAFFNMFHSYPNGTGSYASSWIVGKDGTLQDGLFGPDYRENTRAALTKLQEYFNKGYIDPDFPTYNDEIQRQNLFNDKSGIMFYDLWGAYWPFVLHLDTNPDADWVPVPIVSCDDQPAKTSNSLYTVNGILVAKKGVAHPEALVKMTNLYHDLNNNPETMDFANFNTNPTDNNQIFLAYPLTIYNPSFNYEGYQAIEKALETGDTSGLCDAYKLFYDQAISYRDTKDKAGFCAYRSYTKDGCLGVQQHYMDNKLMQMNEFMGEVPQSMIDNDPTIKKAFDQMYMSIATGGDMAQYDEFLKLYDSVYAPVIKDVNTWFEDNGKVSLQAQFEAAK